MSGSDRAVLVIATLSSLALGLAPVACTPRDACLRHSDCDEGLCLAGRCAGGTGGTGGLGGAGGHGGVADTGTGGTGGNGTGGTGTGGTGSGGAGGGP